VTRVYVASKAKHHRWWAALRHFIPIEASWIDADFNQQNAEPCAETWAAHWQTCITEAAAADICLFVCFEGETACGALVELGAALAAGRQCWIVSDYDWSIAHHPLVRRFATLEDAVAELVAEKPH
jgi:hypothetical protein